MTDCRSEGHYTVLTLQHLLLASQLVNFITLLVSTTGTLVLIMWCETNQLLNCETKQIFESSLQKLF